MFQSSITSPTRLAILDIETAAPATEDDSFPPWPTHRPVVASVLTAERQRYGQWRFALESVTFDADAAGAIERVGQLIERHTVVGFNSRGFDLPVLALEACRTQRFGCAGLSLAWRANRFTGSHIDLLDSVSSFGGARGASLQMLCEQLGIPVKTSTHGSDVGELMAAGEVGKVIAYCEEDVAATLCLAANLLALRYDEPTYAGLVSQFGTWVRERELAHLAPFERLAGSAEFDRLSLNGILDEGLAALDYRMHLRWTTNVPGATGLTDAAFSDND